MPFRPSFYYRAAARRPSKPGRSSFFSLLAFLRAILSAVLDARLASRLACLSLEAPSATFFRSAQAAARLAFSFASRLRDFASFFFS